MSLTNRLGDVEISDPRAMRALAHPVRMAILNSLQRHGPATATSLAPVVGASPSVTSWHLRHLATFGLVENCDIGSDARRRWWRAVGRGFRFSLPEGEEGSAAYSMLAGQLFESSLRQAQTWQQEVEPELDDDWRRLSGTANTRVAVSREELERIEDEIEKLIAPYVTREPEEVPPAARSARLLRIYMPAAVDEATAGADEPGEGGR
jgi:DNA-binding transcriptional ArsR family regulator